VGVCVLLDGFVAETSREKSEQYNLLIEEKQKIAQVLHYGDYKYVVKEIGH
jgi:hypothetical protein